MSAKLNLKDEEIKDLDFIPVNDGSSAVGVGFKASMSDLNVRVSVFGTNKFIEVTKGSKIIGSLGKICSRRSDAPLKKTKLQEDFESIGTLTTAEERIKALRDKWNILYETHKGIQVVEKCEDPKYQGQTIKSWEWWD